MSSQQKKGGWGSVFTGAIANLESRLDTILADEPDASARERAAAAEQQAKSNLQRTNSNRLAASSSSSPSNNAPGKNSSDTARSRVNDRLAERLAKATAQKTPSRTSTPANDARPSGETRRDDEPPKSIPSSDTPPSSAMAAPAAELSDSPKISIDQAQLPKEEPASLTASNLPINPARISADSMRFSTDGTKATPATSSARPSLDAFNGTTSPGKSASELQATIDQMTIEHARADAQRQEEANAYMERIDALQAKLTYLAKETVAAAKEANASAGSTVDKQVAEKDEKIALLMEEGEKLSKNEMKHLQTIKKLRAKNTEDDKATLELKKKLERAEKSEAELKEKLRRAEVAERQASEKLKQIAAIEKQVEELRVDRENAAELVRSLTTQLKDAKDKAAKVEKEAANKASEVDKGTIANLQNELEDAQIEKKLAEDRAASEIKKAKEEADRQKERLNVRELEFKNDIAGLESRLEAMRSMAEEASTSTSGGDGEGSVKLMRQVETLQQQYALAKGNWETIEGSLNARVASLEKERDEATKRESEIRKKAREAGVKLRLAEEELESTTERIRALEAELKTHQEQRKLLQSKLDKAESSQSDAKVDFERQRKVWESDFAARVEEEKLKWRREMATSSTTHLSSPTTSQSRKPSTADLASSRGKPQMQRLTSHDLSALHTDYQRASSASRRNPLIPTPTTASGRGLATPTEASPSISRRESMLSIAADNIPPTPSIEIPDRLSDDGSSPQRTIADLVSTSTAAPGAGPSVQLVERMSSLVRKLESEKASFKDELQRLSQQRDEARNEVVDLMREVEAKRKEEGKLAEVEGELKGLRQRYEASLEILGEREEEVEELRADVVELKRIYKELVETKVGGGGA